MQLILKNKLKCLFLVLFAMVLIAAVAAAEGGGDSRQAGGPRIVIPAPPNAAQRTYALLFGIPQHGSVLGYEDAPVTLQFFGDLQCRESRQVMLGALPLLIRSWVRAGKLRIRFRSLETDTKKAGGYPEFLAQQGAALAAARQDKLWNFVDAFYRAQGPEFVGYVNEAFLNRIATTAGVANSSWEEEREPADWVQPLGRERRFAIEMHVPTTPAFLIGSTGGKSRLLRHFGLDDPEVFDAAIEELLSKKMPPKTRDSPA
jgi:protein-disulfide isomerase